MTTLDNRWQLISTATHLGFASSQHLRETPTIDHQPGSTNHRLGMASRGCADNRPGDIKFPRTQPRILQAEGVLIIIGFSINVSWKSPIRSLPKDCTSTVYIGTSPATYWRRACRVNTSGRKRDGTPCQVVGAIPRCSHPVSAIPDSMVRNMYAAASRSLLFRRGAYEPRQLMLHGYAVRPGSQVRRCWLL